MWSSGGRLMGRTRAGKQAELQWCFEPVYQSGQDIASNPRVLPATFAEHAEQIA
jgi:hypothetical protein